MDTFQKTLKKIESKKFVSERMLQSKQVNICKVNFKKIWKSTRVLIGKDKFLLCPRYCKHWTIYWRYSLSSGRMLIKVYSIYKPYNDLSELSSGVSRYWQESSFCRQWFCRPNQWYWRQRHVVQNFRYWEL